MNGAVKWLRGRQRNNLVLSIALGCSGAAVLGSYSFVRKPLLAESTAVADGWKRKPIVTAQPQHTATREDGSQEQQQFQSDIRRLQQPPPSSQSHAVLDAEGKFHGDALTAWQHAIDRIVAVCGTFQALDLMGLREKFAGVIVPIWLRQLPLWLNKIQNELSMAPWSLSWEIWEEAHDPEVNPEIIWDAGVRVSTDLCPEEIVFLHNRRQYTARALARYLGVPESEIHPDDVPVIAMCGSGGGLRALVAGASSYLSAAEEGLWDCVTYSAGVSGSCWLQTLYYSSIGRQNYEHIIGHLKDRLGVHIAYPPALLGLLSTAPTNKYLLKGLIEKLKGVPDADFGLVDVYGLALAARLLVPKMELLVSDNDLKVSNQRFYTDSGHQPLPIYTAVRHEIPQAEDKIDEKVKNDRASTKLHDWFQWFEWTPYEMFCEDFDAGIPTWAVGRTWQNGHCVWRQNGFALPELRIPLMMGIWGSAFCATLSHYYKEIRPMLQSSGFGGLDTLLAGKNDELVKVHPIDAAVIPNFALGMRNRLPPSCPESIHESTHLQLMDAGMANNLPIYPLLRPGRNVDIIIAFDASADVRGDNWIRAVDGYVRQRNIKGWPMGAGWPPDTNTAEETANELDQAQDAAASTNTTYQASRMSKAEAADLGFCTVWAGSTEELQDCMDEPIPKRIQSPDDATQHLMSPKAGIAVVYFPFLANPKVPGVDPLKSDFMSTWNFIYTSEQIDKVVQLARANFEEGKEQTKRTVRAVWERKRMLRLQKEAETREHMQQQRLRTARAAVRKHGDPFSGL